MSQTVPVGGGTLAGPHIRRLPADRPWQWLQAGWRDLTHTPFASTAYGLVFVVMGYALVWLARERFELTLALISGFLLVGPFLAIGLYDLSLRQEQGKPATLLHAISAWRTNSRNIMLFGVLVALIMIVWARLSALLYALIFLGPSIQLETDLSALFFSGDGLLFLGVFLAVGAVLAVVVFCLSVVSIPMLLDQRCDIFTAVATSIAAVRHNQAPLVLWAVIIVVITGAGMLPAFIGLAVTLPLVGHASWHAYRDLVEMR